MLIFNFILSLIIIFIVFFIILSITKRLLYIFTKYEYDSYYLFLPTFLIMGAWSFVFILWYMTVIYFLDIDLVDIIIKILVKDNFEKSALLNCSYIYIIIALIAQAISLLSINIDYKKLTGNTRFFFKKLLRVRTKKNNKLVIKNDPEKINFATLLLISILTFIIIVISLSILFIIGYLISQKL